VLVASPFTWIAERLVAFSDTASATTTLDIVGTGACAFASTLIVRVPTTLPSCDTVTV